ncbi:S-layer homology domain-containing protein [Lysinibacillus xylanilyticus]|nr:S-layer homology domain-containing protein [Lysinibacillus xylanilyticus]MEB2302595.1 S-layer homology domain-containing protein [Lysinibacillus xylanilyticus]
MDGSNGAFRPNAYITRAQMAKILVLAFDLMPGGKSIQGCRPITLGE